MDDLDDVDLNHPNFRAAFPDGKVPIRYGVMPYSYDGGDVLEHLEWASEQLARIEELDADELTWLADEFQNFEFERTNVQTGLSTRMHERKTIVARMMQGGLTLRQIAKLSEVPESDVAVAATSMAWQERYTSVLDVDEVLARGAVYRGVSKLAREYNLTRDVVRGLQRLRDGLPYAGSSDRMDT